MRTENDVERTFFQAQNSVASVLDVASQLCDQGVRMYGAVLCVTEGIHVLVDRLGNPRPRAKGIHASAGPLSLVSLPWHQGEAPERHVKMFLWVEQDAQVAYALSCQDHESFDYCLATTYRYLAPYASRAFLRTGEIRRALTQLARSQPSVSIRIRELVSRGLIDDPESLKKVRTSREWTDEDYLVVFDKLREERRWVSSLRLEVRASDTCVGRMWKDASFSCDAGLRSFMSSVVQALSDAVVRSRDFFQDRGSATSPTGKPRPVSIQYADGVFSERAQTARLLEVLQKLPESAVSVYHDNPYLHASLIDYSDGSTFDIWVTRQDGILIVPKRKGTHRSMQRVCNHVCDEFEEGDVRDFQPHG